MRRTWALLIAAPLLFLAAIIAASVYFGIVTRGDAQAIAEQTPKAMPIMLVAVQLLLLAFLVRTLRAERLAWSDIGWRLEQGQRFWREALIGIVPGAVLAVLYFTVLSPAMTWLQVNVGDYVPAGELTGASGASLVPFFLANVVLAPFVEESLYRGYTLKRLQQRYGLPLAVIISSRVLRLVALDRWDLVYPADGPGGRWAVRRSARVAGHARCAVRRTPRAQYP